jgi:hypothetical protein
MCRLHPELSVKKDEVMQLTPAQCNRDADASPSFYTGRKLREVEQALLWTFLQEEPACPSRALLDKAAGRQIQIGVSLRQVNRWRVRLGLNGPKGRPRQAQRHRSVGALATVVEVMPHVSFVGVHLFAHWLEQHDAFGAVVGQLKEAIESHQQSYPEDDFALLHHREQTLRRRFEALFVAPLLGINRLSEFDTREHGLESLLGRGYQSSTLHQFLGHLERVGAAQALMATLVPQEPGQITYVDGHMIAYWSRVPMHKGKITMLGRIMAGSQAVVAHDETGQAVFVAYYAPDIHLSQVIVTYCQQVAAATGSRVFVIDRAVNSVALARAFDEQGLGLLCMLDDNEHQGRDGFEATQIDPLADGPKVFGGPWKELRLDDPRTFVIVEPPEGKTLVYWGTPQVESTVEPSAWPRLYRERSEIQENSFKRMIDHGALNINYGRKKIVGPDRHHQRAGAKLQASLESAQKRFEDKTEALKVQQEKVAQSEVNGHGKRLEQRKRTLSRLERERQEAMHKRDQLSERLSTLGPPGQRADRDVRKQTIMTIRTLLLENFLLAFMAVLLEHLQTTLSLSCLLQVLFARSGCRVETATEVRYWVNTAGLSVAYRRLLAEVVRGLCAMGLQHQGKPIRVCLKDTPP